MIPLRVWWEAGNPNRCTRSPPSIPSIISAKLNPRNGEAVLTNSPGALEKEGMSLSLATPRSTFGYAVNPLRRSHSDLPYAAESP